MPGTASESPRVSVILRVYNQRLYLPAAVDSVLDQTLSEFELILVDDGSTDGTSAFIDEVGTRDGRIRVHHQANAGISSATNAGLAMARAPYVALFDGDDLCMPQRLEKQAAFLDTHPDVGMVGCNMIEIDADGRRIGELRYPSSAFEVSTRMINAGTVGGPVPMMRRQLAQAIGGWRSVFDFAEDYDFCLRFNERWPIVNLPDFLIAYRRHQSQTTALHRRRQKAIAMVARVAARCRRDGRPDPIRPGTVMDASLADILPLTPRARVQLRAQFEGQEEDTPSPWPA